MFLICRSKIASVMGIDNSKVFISELLSQILADAAVFTKKHFNLIKICKNFIELFDYSVFWGGSFSYLFLEIKQSFSILGIIILKFNYNNKSII